MICKKYGAPHNLELKDVEKPIPADNELLVKIKAASVNALDWHFLRGKPFLVRLKYGLLKPKNQILGYDISGIVESIGKNVKNFKPGDEIFGGLGFKLGGFAEYACIDENGMVALKPNNMSFKEAAAVPAAGITAFLSIRDRASMKSGQRILVNGAAGGVGTFSVQIARYYGAHITAVCSSGNVEMVKSIGAEQVIDYTKEDFTCREEMYDVVIDNVGNRGVKHLLKVLNNDGIYVGVGFTSMGLMMQQSIIGPLAAKRGGKRWSVPQSDEPLQKDFVDLKKIIEDANLTSVIDRAYSLNDLSKAIEYMETGHAKAKVVIEIN